VQKEEEEEDGDAVVEIEGLGWKLSSRRSPHLTDLRFRRVLSTGLFSLDSELLPFRAWTLRFAVWLGWVHV
jgi:hypothetical protein